MEQHPPLPPVIDDPSLEALAVRCFAAKREEGDWGCKRNELERELLRHPAVQARLREQGDSNLQVGNYLIGTWGSVSYSVIDAAAFETALATIPPEMRPVVTRLGRPALDQARLRQMRAERPDLFSRLEPTLRVTQRTRVIVKPYSCQPEPTTGIEIYVRPSGDRVLLNLHLSEAARSALLMGLMEGSFEPREVRIHLELSALGKWLTQDRGLFAPTWAAEEAAHLRIPITAINVVTAD
jgi:hypothetical protein